MAEVDRKLRIEELALLIGTSTQTINNWYRWRKLKPDHPLAKMLPDYVQEGCRQTRTWKSSDVWKIIEFKNNLPHGRNGVLGEITQRRYKKSKEVAKNEQSEVESGGNDRECEREG